VLLNSVIIILREVLEAALLISVLLVLTQSLDKSFRWVAWALLAGLIGATVYGISIDVISEWFDGVGQEVVNALLQVGIFSLIAVTMVLLPRQLYARESGGLLAVMMILMVALVLTREGAEIMIYLSGFLRGSDQLSSVLLGAAIGASIGISAGVLFYYLLRNRSERRTIGISVVVLMLVGSGMASQAAQLLIQADWLPAQLPIWDSSGWISESSVTGQLLYALIGYEATPAAIQAGFHFGGLLLLVMVFLVCQRRYRASTRLIVDA
jgi:high-affinity iron transporter